MRGKAAWLVVIIGAAGLGVWWWAHGKREAAQTPAAGTSKGSSTAAAAPTKLVTVAAGDKSIADAVPTNRLAYRLSNTKEAEKELLRNDRAVLLQNALIDTTQPLSDLNIPDKLKAPADNHDWVVQARGPISPGFRVLLSGSGAQVVSYIPNNAELVVASKAVAQQLAASPVVADVLPYAPYYKLTDPNLLKLAVGGADLPPDVGLRVGVFPGMQGATEAALNAMGAEVTDEGASPFGEILGVHPAAGTFVNVAQLGGVMVVEAEHRRTPANDLTRARLGVAANPVTNTDYIGLSGQGVLVAVNDSGVDTNHPDLAGRMILDATASGLDPVGHGTHVIGTIMGSGVESATVGTNASGSPTNANFRGMATNAQAYVIAFNVSTRPGQLAGTPSSDAYLQETAGRTNAQIDNNSWDYGGDAAYDMAAASYDMAVRDSVPEWTGPQSLLYVFSAGNSGGAASDGTGGIADTVLSPGTAKNVITVGSIEQLRDITNKDVVDGVTNQPWLAETDSSNQVAEFSSRGNVGVGIEGEAGRFKPDVVAPGTFVLSDKAASWDQGAYYNPTNVTVNTLYNQTVTNGILSPYSIFVPPNAVSVTITLVTNDFSPSPFPILPIYIGLNDNPTTNAGGYDAMGNGTVTLTLNGTPALPAGSEIFYSVGDVTNGLVGFDINTAVATTNDNGNYLTVLSNLNASLGPYYRYESGTSMSAAGVSGTLALMEEFLRSRLGVTNPSPALLKALLINGARTASSQYDFSVSGALTSQGWGLPNLSNSVPGVLTNGGPNQPLQFFDGGTNMLATGQSQTRVLKLANGAGSQPLRVTLVWTDPPGNPAAGVKLVNDLDLVVSNLDSGTVFYGNDIPAGSDYNVARGATNTVAPDSVNNVENVYLFPPLGTNYTITVNAHRVNVNAVDANTNNVVQDYALVVSYGDGGVFTNGFTLTNLPVVSSNVAAVAGITNGIPVLNQRVGGNPQYAETNGNTNGVIGQWQFYVYTNTVSLTNAAYTNVAFVTFDPPNLGVPIMGTREEANPANGVRTEADIDLYVSTDPNLTNLNPASMNAAYQSLSRTGTEKVLLTGQPRGQVYYVGVKSEDQEGAQYGFVAVALTNSFGQFDSNGNVVLTVITPPLPAQIPGGTPAQPGSVTVLALTTADVQARKVVIEDTVTHQEFGDLVGVVGHGAKTAVLNNHSFFVNPDDQTETFIYDDSGENGDQFILNNGQAGQYLPPFNVTPGPNTGTPRHTDGPGTLTSFVGDNVSDGIWTLTMVNDSSPNDSGTIDNWTAFVEPQSPNNGFSNTIPADSWYYDFVDVPANATNLVITVGISGATTGPVDLYVRRGAFPDFNDYDKFQVINPPGGVMTLSIFDSPPLNAGRYFIGVFNPNAFPVTVSAHWTLGLAASGPPPLNILSVGNEPILDDAVTYSTNHVGAVSKVVSVEVGVRINHPRESDLVLTLLSPSGTRVLLAENRGGLDTNGYGHGTDFTNYVGTATAGSYAPTNTVIPVGTNSGTLDIAYNFFTIPDDLRVYYGGQRIFDSGLISGAGTFTVDFGPGSATNVTIAMNEPGTNPNGTNGDAWTYQVDEITKAITYATFTEDTNKTTTPIKFAVPPFGGAPQYLPTVTNVISTFEGSAPGDYTTPVDGWTVVGTNPVKVVTVTALAANEGNPLAGSNVLALHNGSITRVLPTVAGQTYTLTFESHGRPAAGPYNGPGPAGWWKAEGNALDSSGNGNIGTIENGPGYAPGEVSNAFVFDGVNQYVDIADKPTLDPTNALTIETWFNPTGANNSTILAPLLKKEGPNEVNGYALEYGGVSGGLIFYVYTGIGTSWYGTPQSPAPPLNTWTHMAGVYDGTNVYIYMNGIFYGSTPVTGTLVNSALDLWIASTPDPMDFPQKRYFDGSIDEATVYSNALSQLQVQDIYAAGSAGKCLPGNYFQVPANVVLDGQTNVIAGNDNWSLNTYTFTASSNGTVLTIAPGADGLLVDSFALGGAAELNPANYYLPEETLDTLQGENSEGDWKLEVWDNRLGATNPEPSLVSWQLSLGLERVNPAAMPLNEGIPATNCLQATSVAYYVVNVPVWAGFATNILTVENGTVGLVYNQNSLPLTTNGDVTLIPNTGTGGTVVLNTTNSTPLLVPGQSYYLAVTNPGPGSACFTIGVDYNIITLTNLMPVTNSLAATTVPAYYQYDVSSNAVAVAFELYNLSGNVNLVVRKGFPLPDTNSVTDYNYISQNPGTNDELILVSSNSTPVVLTPGWWYLGVFNADVNPVNYTIEAAELTPTVIVLTNDERLTTNFSLLQSEETFFEFAITNSPAGALFELYSLSGNVDLTLGQNTLPFAPPFFASSANPGTNEEQIVIRTNQLGTPINGAWYLGVPNETSSNVTFTIHAVVTDTNGLLVSAVPIAPVVVVPSGPGTGPTLTWPSVSGECYEVDSSPDLVNWTELTVVTASGTTTTVTDPNPITGVPARFYRIIQVVCP